MQIHKYILLFYCLLGDSTNKLLTLLHLEIGAKEKQPPQSPKRAGRGHTASAQTNEWRERVSSRSSSHRSSYYLVLHLRAHAPLPSLLREYLRLRVCMLCEERVKIKKLTILHRITFSPANLLCRSTHTHIHTDLALYLGST